MESGAAMTGQRYVVIGGAGAVGSLFVDLLTGDGADVCIVDRRRPGGAARNKVRFLLADIEQPNGQLAVELSQAALVLLAVPEDVALNALGRIIEHVPPGALLVDVLTVKTRIVAAEQAMAASQHVVSLNPMFAPSLGLTGRPIATVVVHDGPPVQHLLARLTAWGARPVVMNADHHDQLAAATQALTHAAVLAVGLALTELDVDIDELRAVGPPPHQTLLALLARIVSAPPEAYWDVQAGNPHGRRARAVLQAGVRALDAAADSGDAGPFHRITSQLRGLLGDHLADYGDRCARAFTSTAEAPRPNPATVTLPERKTDDSV
jgi:4-amino-4-deoxyprephenate dehydrogenase